jgi:hypothetical protein
VLDGAPVEDALDFRGSGQVTSTMADVQFSDSDLGGLQGVTIEAHSSGWRSLEIKGWVGRKECFLKSPRAGASSVDSTWGRQSAGASGVPILI